MSAQSIAGVRTKTYVSFCCMIYTYIPAQNGQISGEFLAILSAIGLIKGITYSEEP